MAFEEEEKEAAALAGAMNGFVAIQKEKSVRLVSCVGLCLSWGVGSPH
jgi:hypothetical protein